MQITPRHERGAHAWGWTIEQPSGIGGSPIISVVLPWDMYWLGPRACVAVDYADDINPALVGRE